MLGIANHCIMAQPKITNGQCHCIPYTVLALAMGLQLQKRASERLSPACVCVLTSRNGPRVDTRSPPMLRCGEGLVFDSVRRSLLEKVFLTISDVEISVKSSWLLRRQRKWRRLPARTRVGTVVNLFVGKGCTKVSHDVLACIIRRHTVLPFWLAFFGRVEIEKVGAIADNIACIAGHHDNRRRPGVRHYTLRRVNKAWISIF